MGNIQVRRLPDNVLRALRDRSAAHGRSMEAEVRDIITAAVLPPGRVKIGSMLAAIGDGAQLTPDEFAEFDNRDRSSAREVDL